MRTFLVAATTLFALGCYAPNPPGGSYRCSTIDNKTCPSGQTCTCGLCVDHPTQAACKFNVTTSAPTGANTLSVSEHQQFSLQIDAIDAEQNPASAFNGTVNLSSSWGDVTPATVTLKNGTATAMVELNRETLPPQTTKVRAEFFGNHGDSGKIAVVAQQLIRQATPVVPPATALMPFGWANMFVAQPNIIKVDSGYRMYFIGRAMKDNGTSIGVATSPDGNVWTPEAEPVITSPAMGGLGTDISSPSVYKVGASYNAVVSKGSATGDIGLGTSPDGLTAWTVYNGGAGVLKETDCAYCTGGLNFPQVIADPTSLDNMGNPTQWIMFFNATKMGGGVSIGRAQSNNGTAFVPEPAPLLSGDLSDEALLLSPRILVDGTVFKMWYSFAKIGDIGSLLDLCGDDTNVGVGYATSDDGFYWIRSPSNPVLAESTTGWDSGDRTTVVSSVLPSDGVDPKNGIDMYYTTFRKTALTCLPNGIGKATRP